MSPVPQELRCLIDEYVNGEMDADRFILLQAWLADDPEARAYFIEYWQMVAELYVEARAECAIKRFEASARTSLPTTELESASLSHPSGSGTRNSVRGYRSFIGFAGDLGHQTWSIASRHSLLCSVAAVLIFVVAVVVWKVQGGSGITGKSVIANHSSTGDEPSPQATRLASETISIPGIDASGSPRKSIVARLVSADCEWVHPESVLDENAPLTAGQKLELASGQAQIVFQCGAEVNLCGPAIFEIESAKSAILTIGRLSARADTPQAHGFTIHSRTASAVDLGTEFNVVASVDGHSQIRVVEGAVEVHLANGRQRRRLDVGQSLEVEPGSPSVIARVEPGEGTAAFRFPTIEPPSNQDYADSSQRHAQIRVVRGHPKKDSGPVEVLLNGKGQSQADSPNESFFFSDNEVGRILLDLGRKIRVQKVNSYSWHQHHLTAGDHIRATQKYYLYGASRATLPATDGNLTAAGWTLIAQVDTDEFFGFPRSDVRPAQQAVSITNSEGGSIGEYRYLLWDVRPTRWKQEDGHSANTFYGEFDVYAMEKQESEIAK